ncbi:cell division cycle-associated protein 7-like isoform X1 [Mizuhopecten yessoensis]|uniref:Cell division cycle-associated 7-like protein n=3 Tax=Mizuhopecten yessoensis TaxID=6573 RepID=A0A210PS93_MIZYE|nr:cell division cycle-associated protein 7-like isoform X1 [Mizuhopecten yessoensis]OWF39363.1 Cell division cycle-associated 7-like protein [Mizuhopecten yessoensis]
MASHYEELRNKNLEDNKVMLDKLLHDLKGTTSQPVERPARKTRAVKSMEMLPTRRNPSRNARYTPLDEYSIAHRRQRRGSVSSSISSSSSATSPSSSPNKLFVRFGFFQKSTGRPDEADETDSMNSDNDEEEPTLPKRAHRIVHDSRPAEDITEDDIEMVAELVSEKKYDSFYGTSCHQCRQKTNDMKTICRSGHCIGVRGQFCGPCLRNRYGENAKEALKNESWSCPPCRKICNCSFCRKKNGKGCTGILIHMARTHGFSDVNAYLQSLKK